MSALTYRVAWSYANVRIIDPATTTMTVVGLVKGQPVPSTADPEDVKRLTAKGALEPIEAPTAPAAPPVSEPDPAPEAKPAKAAKRREESDS